MSRKFLVALDLGKNELQNAAIQNLGGAPGTPVKGQVYFDTTNNTLWWWDGTAWVSARGGGTGFPGFGSVTQEQTFGAVKNDGVATTTARADHQHGNPVHDAAAHSTIPLDALADATSDIDMGGNSINNVTTPNGPGTALQGYAAQKGYVDYLGWKQEVDVATTANITLSGFQVIDGIAVNISSRVLVKNQTTAAQNGIYQPSSGAWGRSGDQASAGYFPQATVWVGAGSQANTCWMCTNIGWPTVGTTAINWTQVIGVNSLPPGFFSTVVPEQTFGAAPANGTSLSPSRSDHQHGNPVHDAAAHSAIPLSALAVPTAAVSFNSQKITNLADPTAATDGANKQYVDNLIAGLAWKTSVRVATTTNITLSGSQTIDGQVVGTPNRVLVKNQTTPSQHGIYVVNSGGAWTRATDMDTEAEFINAAVWVERGATQADTAWVCTVDQPVMDTSNMPFVQFAGGGTVTGGAGLTQSGNTLNVIAGDTSLIVNADEVHVNTAVIATVASVTPKADKTTTISTTAPLTGGGDLSANRTLAITSFAGTVAGAVPVSVGGTANFLRADGTWAAPIGGVRKFAADCAAALTTVVNHAFATKDVVVDVYRVASPYDSVECDVERTDINNVTVRFGVAPAAADYRIVVAA